MCYDVTDRNSFMNINVWLEDIKKVAVNNPKLILVGTKCELEHRRYVKTEEGEKFAKDNNMDFIEVSSKTGKNINDCFSILTKSIYSTLLSDTNKHITQSGIDTGIKKNIKDCSYEAVKWLKIDFIPYLII